MIIKRILRMNKDFIEFCIQTIEKEDVDPKQNDHLFKTVDDYYKVLEKFNKLEYDLISSLNLTNSYYCGTSDEFWSKEDLPKILKEKHIQKIHEGLLKIGENRGFDPDAIYDNIDTECFVDKDR
jgi:hypothetical protein